MATAREFEITLAVHRRTLARLDDSALRAFVVGAPRTQSLVTAYWDTPALDLRRIGFALRMRNTGQGWIQSMKAHTGTPFLRHETECAAPDERPDLAVAKRAARAMRKRWPATMPMIAPVFTTRVERTVWPVRFADGTRANVAADHGLLQAHGTATELPISEIEIELEDGNVAPLYELAFRLVHELPRARLLFASKADRGYALATGQAPLPRRAQSWTIDSDWKPARLLARAAADCMSQVQANIEGVRGQSDVQYLHQMRIGVRRARTLFRVADAAGLGEVPPRLRDEVKWIWTLLGDSRDWDVFAETTWPRIRGSAGVDDASLAAFTSAVDARRAASHAALRRALDGKRVQKALLALGWFFAHASQADAGGKSVPKLSRRILDRQHARLRRDGASLAQADDDQRHRLRIDAKKVRYVAEFFESLHPPRAARAYLKALSRVQDVLGDLNDVAVTHRLARQALAQVAPAHGRFVLALIEGYAAGSSAQLLSELRPAWKAFSRQRPFWQKH